MANDKQKAKKAILGELESIKSLLENNLHDDSGSDDDVEPPLLLQEVVDEENEEFLDDMLFDDDTGLDHGEGDEDSAPLLTEAFNSVIDNIARSSSEDNEADVAPTTSRINTTSNSAGTDDIESLYADIYRSLKQGSHADDPSLDNLAFQSVPTLEPVTDEELQDLELLSESNDELETEPETQTSSSLTAHDDTPTTSLFDDANSDSEVDNRSDGDAEQPEIADAAEVTSTSTQREKSSTADKQTQAQRDRSQIPPQRAARQVAAGSTSALQESAINSSITKSSTQRSLFVEEHESSSSVTATQQAIELSKKTENPFLPKHIRDRLQGNRSTPPPATTVPPAQPVAASSNSKSSEEQLVDELVKTYLPKIERELRERLRNMLQRQEGDKKT